LLPTRIVSPSRSRKHFDFQNAASGYRCVALKDACFDRDEEVHRVLVEKIFPAQAAVLTVKGFIAG
jgi:nicotinamidase-related amidase